MRPYQTMWAAVIAVALVGVLPAPVSAQVALEGSIDSSLRGDLNTGLRGDLFSGIVGNLGDARRGRPNVNGGLPESFERQGCPPSQVSIYNTGCRPVEFLSSDSFGTYERSSQALGPLQNLTLDGAPSGAPGVED